MHKKRIQVLTLDPDRFLQCDQDVVWAFSVKTNGVLCHACCLKSFPLCQYFQNEKGQVGLSATTRPACWNFMISVFSFTVNHHSVCLQSMNIYFGHISPSLARPHLSQTSLFLLSQMCSYFSHFSPSAAACVRVCVLCVCERERPKSIIQDVVQALILKSDLQACWLRMLIPASNFLQGQHISLRDCVVGLRKVFCCTCWDCLPAPMSLS